jgi:hypothetical protein
LTLDFGSLTLILTLTFGGVESEGFPTSPPCSMRGEVGNTADATQPRVPAASGNRLGCGRLTAYIRGGAVLSHHCTAAMRPYSGRQPWRGALSLPTVHHHFSVRSCAVLPRCPDDVVRLHPITVLPLWYTHFWDTPPTQG